MSTHIPDRDVNGHPSLVSTASEAEQEPLALTDRRGHRRNVVAQLAWLDNVRLKYGPQVTLLDLSPGGAQIETTGYPLQPGSAIVLEIRAAGQTKSLPGHVVRCQLASLSPQPTYRGSVSFKRLFEFPAAPAPGEGDDADCDPADECAALNLALKRVSRTADLHAPTITNGALTPRGARILDNAFSMVESALEGTAAAQFRSEVGRLLRTASRCVESAAAPDAIVTEMIERLRRSIPSLTIRVVESGTSVRRQDEAVSFKVPCEHDEAPAQLVIEFPKDCPLDEWHLQLLQVASGLIGAIRTLA